MRILVCGSRDWDNYSLIMEKLSILPRNSTIIHGGCTGADEFAGSVAAALGLSVEVFHADWKNLGRRAGPARNQRMLEEGFPDVVYAFHDNVESSRGTKDMLKRAKKFGIPTFLFSQGEQRSILS